MRTITADLDGPFSYADYGGQGPPLVMVHGLGGSHLNWMAAAPRLVAANRVLAPDLAGFGLTPLAGRKASLPANRRLLSRFLKEIVGSPAVLVGNSMGGLLSLLQAAEEPGTVAALVLVGPAVPAPPAAQADILVWGLFAGLMVPGLAEAVMRASMRRSEPAALVARTLALTCSDPARVPQEVVAAHVRLAAERLVAGQAERALAMAARSLVAILSRPLLVRRAQARISAPTLIVQGSLDRLVPQAAVQLLMRRRPDWQLEVMPGIGHVPMLEDAPGFSRIVSGWLERTLEATIQPAPVI